MAAEERDSFTIGAGAVGVSISITDALAVYRQFFVTPLPAPAMWLRQEGAKRRGKDEQAVKTAGLRPPTPQEEHSAHHLYVAVLIYAIGRAVTTEGEVGGFLADIDEGRLLEADWIVLRAIAMRELQRTPGWTDPKEPQKFFAELELLLRAAAGCIVAKALPLVRHRV